MRILIVDDSAMIRMMLEHALKKWGYQPIAVDNSTAAIACLLAEPIQFVITDWIMPGGDGPSLCRKIRELNQAFYVYIILVTSLEGSQSLVDGMDAGADDFVHKPIQMDELHARIKAGVRVLELEKTLQERNLKLQELSTHLLSAQEIINRDLQLAERMQRKLLPTGGTTVQGVAIDGLFCPSGHVSGDIYNFFRLDEEYIGFYSVDVAGHGVAAAMMSFTLSQLLTPDLNRGSPLKCSLPHAPYYEIVTHSAAVVEALNNQFQMDAVNSLYFTMIYGVVNTKLRTINLCQAGHPNPIYLPKAGQAQLIGDGGFPVGITTLAEYESITLNYQQGDRLFFYSDGITECTNKTGEMFGEKRLVEFIEQTRQLMISEVLNLLAQRMRLWRGGEQFDDDISMLVLIMADTL